MTADRPEEPWSFPYEGLLHDLAPTLHGAQNEWLGAIDSLSAPDRRTHELIRLACAVVLRSPAAIERHTRLAAEVGATWPDIAGAILLTQPGFGVLPAVQALPQAREIYERLSEQST